MNNSFPPEKEIKTFQQKIFHFYQENKRDLPWRKTTDPYKILVSEFMLQQTQVSRVIEYYTNWMNTWPTVKRLASESYKNVLQAWMGLGYNRRALYLHNTAKVIVDEFDGDVLTAVKHYEKLPGIGLYTSKAIQIFAANADIATVDTNIRRIFISEFDLDESVSDKELFTIAKRCLPRGKSREWHNALMDYGALHLTSRKTGIKPKTQQSIFQGSDRQIRGKILRLLLKEDQSAYQLEKELNVESKRLSKILTKMLKEETVSKTKELYHVPQR
ncbi:MAG TPA: Fe-S cluster assembly protein HesB [Candidatus Thermoplasmatota archaeon]|nr:Fe-S cluster assembly protein HesB [Candidatus Thermoplasmatota archaeon]